MSFQQMAIVFLESAEKLLLSIVDSFTHSKDTYGVPAMSRVLIWNFGVLRGTKKKFFYLIELTF